jgi:alpha-tubulin suppressor-like RCC1 family protein
VIRTDRSLWCWGGNTHGQLGLGDKRKRITPQPVT